MHANGSVHVARLAYFGMFSCGGIIKHLDNVITCFDDVVSSLRSLSSMSEQPLDLKPQDRFGRFVNIFLDLQKVDHTCTISKHH